MGQKITLDHGGKKYTVDVGDLVEVDPAPDTEGDVCVPNSFTLVVNDACITEVEGGEEYGLSDEVRRIDLCDNEMRFLIARFTQVLEDD